MDLSSLAYDRILKVAPTIADLAGLETISSDHVSKAIQYYSWTGNCGHELEARVGIERSLHRLPASIS